MDEGDVYEGHCAKCENGDYFKHGDEEDCRCPAGCHQAIAIDEAKEIMKYGR